MESSLESDNQVSSNTNEPPNTIIPTIISTINETSSIVAPSETNTEAREIVDTTPTNVDAGASTTEDVNPNTTALDSEIKKPAVKRKRTPRVKTEGAEVTDGTSPKKPRGRPIRGPVPMAYAKLEGMDINTDMPILHYITDVPVVLGRDHSNSPEHFINLGDSKCMSKIHATIDFDKTSSKFTLDIHGKSGAIVRGIRHAVGEKVSINTRDPIKIDSYCFYFLQAITEKKPSASYTKLIQQAFKKVGNGVPLGINDLVQLIAMHHTFFKDAREVELAKALQGNIKRSHQNYVTAGIVKVPDGEDYECYLLSSDDSQLANDVKGADNVATIEHDYTTYAAAVSAALEALS